MEVILLCLHAVLDVVTVSKKPDTSIELIIPLTHFPFDIFPSAFLVKRRKHCGLPLGALLVVGCLLHNFSCIFCAVLFWDIALFSIISVHYR